MGLFNDLIKEFAGFYLLIAANGNTFFFCLLECAAKFALFHFRDIREAQFPFPIFLHGAHERVGDPHRDIEVRNLILIGLGGNKVFHIRMVHAQDSHVGASSCSALGDLAKRMIIDA